MVPYASTPLFDLAEEGVYSAVEVFSVNFSLVRADNGRYLEKDPGTPLHNATMQE